MSADEDHGARQGAWLDIVRRSRVGREAKLAAVIFASYANADGTGITCSAARLALDCEWSYASARRYLAWMRKVGLVELSQRGNRRRGETDKYRLILAPEILETLEIPDPDTYKKEIGRIHEVNRTTQKAARRRRKSALTQDERQSPVDNSGTDDQATEDQRSPSQSAKTRISAHIDTGLALTPNALTSGCVPGTSHLDTSHKKETSHLETAEPSLQRSRRTRASRSTDIEDQRSQMSPEEAARYAAAKELLFREPDLGVAAQEEARAWLGAKARAEEVVILAAERFAERRLA